MEIRWFLLFSISQLTRSASIRFIMSQIFRAPSPPNINAFGTDLIETCRGTQETTWLDRPVQKPGKGSTALMVQQEWGNK